MADWFDRRHILDFDSSVAMRYHARRRAFLEFLARLDPALSLVLGAATFGTLITGFPKIAACAAFATTASSATNLAFGTADRARRHDTLFRQWAEFRAELASIESENERELQYLEVKRAKLDGECPGQLTALSVICENEEKAQRGDEGRCEVRWYQALFANWGTLPPWQFNLEKPNS